MCRAERSDCRRATPINSTTVPQARHHSVCDSPLRSCPAAQCCLACHPVDRLPARQAPTRAGTDYLDSWTVDRSQRDKGWEVSASACEHPILGQPPQRAHFDPLRAPSILVQFRYPSQCEGAYSGSLQPCAGALAVDASYRSPCEGNQPPVRTVVYQTARLANEDSNSRTRADLPVPVPRLQSSKDAFLAGAVARARVGVLHVTAHGQANHARAGQYQLPRSLGSPTLG